MKNNRFILSILACAICIISANAQKEIPDSTELLFDSNGSFTRVINTPQEVEAKLISVNPLLDDVVWRKAVLRVIDLREQVNRPLYYPYEDLGEFTQKNLFSIMFYNMLEGNLTGYLDQAQIDDQTFVPEFKPVNAIKLDSMDLLSSGSMPYRETSWDKVNWLTPGITKFYIQEVWYFNKTTSTFHNKIIAIAPIYDQKYNPQEPEIRSGVWFWMPYDKLRPFLQEEFIKLSGRNLTPSVNFDDFFTTRKFYSYIIKDYDLNSRPVDYGTEDPIYIKQEQDRIEAEILNFEQDLWQY